MIKKLPLLILLIALTVGCSNAPNINEVQKTIEKDLIQNGRLFKEMTSKIKHNETTRLDDIYYKINLDWEGRAFGSNANYYGGVTNIRMYRAYDDKKFGAYVYKWCSGNKKRCDSLAHMVAKGGVRAVGNVGIYFKENVIGSDVRKWDIAFVLYNNGITYSIDKYFSEHKELSGILASVYANERENKDFKKYARNGVQSVSYSKVEGYLEVMNEQAKAEKMKILRKAADERGKAHNNYIKIVENPRNVVLSIKSGQLIEHATATLTYGDNKKIPLFDTKYSSLRNKEITKMYTVAKKVKDNKSGTIEISALELYGEILRRFVADNDNFRDILNDEGINWYEVTFDSALMEIVEIYILRTNCEEAKKWFDVLKSEHNLAQAAMGQLYTLEDKVEYCGKSVGTTSNTKANPLDKNDPIIGSFTCPIIGANMQGFMEFKEDGTGVDVNPMGKAYDFTYIKKNNSITIIHRIDNESYDYTLKIGGNQVSLEGVGIECYKN